MTCYHPIDAWYSFEKKTSKGNRAITFSMQDAIPYTHFQIPCGQCIGCRLARSADAMVRCIHESKMWPVNTFVTLTYSDNYLPEDNGLCFRDLQLFWKRLRRYYDGRKIRYFACGEYGTLGHRPHYHAIIFNCDFADKKPFFKAPSGAITYRSDILSDIWGLGYCTVGDCTPESAGYVARYVTKKITGDGNRNDYVDDDGVCISKENSRWSRDPFIGGSYLAQYWEDIYLRGDRCLVNYGGKMKKFRVPRAYDKWLAENKPEVFADIKAERAKSALEYQRSSESSWQRMRVKEELHQLRAQKLVRNLEEQL